MTQTNKKQNRTKRLPDVRVTMDELSAMKSKADEAGLSFSDYARRALLSGVIVVRNERDIAEFIGALGAIGNNLNQIARGVNIHGNLSPENNEHLSYVLPALSALIDRCIDGS